MTKPDKKTREDACLDEALADTFPASDPPAQTNPSHGTRVDNDSLNGAPGAKPEH